MKTFKQNGVKLIEEKNSCSGYRNHDAEKGSLPSKIAICVTEDKTQFMEEDVRDKRG